MVEQTYSELVRYLDESYVVHMYYGDVRPGTGDGKVRIKGKLQRQHEIFSPKESYDPAYQIVVSSHATFTLRHGAKQINDWVHNVRGPGDAATLKDKPNTECPDSLTSLFDLVACDECHFAKNASTELNKLLRLLELDFTLLICATPGINSIQDFQGYFKIVQPRIVPRDSTGTPYTKDSVRFINPFEPGRERPMAMLNEHMAKRYIFDNPDQATAAINLKTALGLECCLGRGLRGGGLAAGLNTSASEVRRK